MFIKLIFLRISKKYKKDLKHDMNLASPYQKLPLRLENDTFLIVTCL